MNRTKRPSDALTGAVLTSPAAIGLPLLDKGYAESRTRALIGRSWPAIEESVASRDYRGAIDALTTLAVDMSRATALDHEAWRQTLDESRSLVYDAIVVVATAGGLLEQGIGALDASISWDGMHRQALLERRRSLEAGSR